jgi:hypothetical protein
MALGALAVLLVVVAWGFQTLQPWGRVGAAVVGVVSLAGVPIGTVIWGLVLAYLFKPEVRLVFAGRQLSPDEQRRAVAASDLWKPLGMTIGVLNIILMAALALGAVAILLPMLLRR